MKSIFFEASVAVTHETVPGSQAEIETGAGSTARNPGTCNPGWFVGGTTIILGAGNADTGPAIARWHLLVEPALIRQCEAGYLVICCERPHGGLHTARKGALVRVAINGQNRDLIGLKDKPAGHTDYFHRIPKPPQLPSVWPVSGCATVYSWPVDGRHLADSGTQVVTVELEKDVSWDIDYVSLLISHTSYHVREPCKQVVYVLLGVVLAAIAAVLVGG